VASFSGLALGADDACLEGEDDGLDPIAKPEPAENAPDV